MTHDTRKGPIWAATTKSCHLQDAQKDLATNASKTVDACPKLPKHEGVVRRQEPDDGAAELLAIPHDGRRVLVVE